MKSLYDITKTALEALTAKGAQKAYCSARRSETLEFNVDGGEFSLMRTLFDSSLHMTAIKDNKKGSVGLNSFDDIAAAADGCIAAAEASQPDTAWDIAPGCGEKRFTTGALTADKDALFSRSRELVETIQRDYPSIIIEQMTVSHVKGDGVYRNTNGSVFTTSSGYYCAELMFSAHEGEKSSSFFSSGVICDNLDRPFIELGSVRRDLRDVECQIETVAADGKKCGIMLLSPGCLESFIGDIAGNFASDRVLLDGISIWRDKLGERVADERITIELAPSSPQIVCGESYTGEGFISEDYYFIREGRLESFMTGLYTANKTGLPRAKNSSDSLIMAAGDKPLEDIIRSIDYGILVGRFSGGEPGAGGDFSGVAKNSFIIRDGKLAGAAGETMISGNLADMLNNLVAVSSERICDGAAVLPWAAFSGITISGK